MGASEQSPGVNKIQGLTPQKRLMSSQKMDDSSMGTNAMRAVQATTVGTKEQFQSEVSLKRIEPKRSVSASAKK